MNATTGTEKIDLTEEQSNSAAVSDVEVGIRDFVRNDVANLRRPAPSPSGSIAPVTEQSPEVSVNNVNSLIQRVAGASIQEIEKLISELESLRDLLHAEGKRVQREISGYAQLSQAAMKSTRLIADNVEQWKGSSQQLIQFKASRPRHRRSWCCRSAFAMAPAVEGSSLQGCQSLTSGRRRCRGGQALIVIGP